MTSFQLQIAELRFSFKGDHTQLSFPESYQAFIQEGGEPDAVFEWRGKADSRVLSLFENRSPLLDTKLWGVYHTGAELVFISPGVSITPSTEIVTWSPSLRCGEMHSSEQPLLSPLGDLTLPVLGHIFAQQRGMLVHAAAVKVRGRAWVFLGRSGSGKSHWSGQLGARGAAILGDDRIVLRERAGRIKAFGTPWNKEPHLCSPLGYPVERLFFLREAAQDAVQAVPQSTAAALFMRSCFLPIYDPAAMHAILDVSSQLVLQASTFFLGYETGPGLLDRLLAM